MMDVGITAQKTTGAKMSVFRVNKTSNYTVMSNFHLKDKRISLKAKGLLSQMLSLPDDWDFTIPGLAYINRENESAIKSALTELRENGYLVVTKMMPGQTKSGRIEYIYDIYENPQQQQEGKKQGLEILGVEIQGVENHPLNKYIDNKDTDNKVQNNNSIGQKRKRFVRPTIDEVKEYCTERKNNIDPQKFFDHYEANGWKVGKNSMKDWRAAVRYWENSGYNTAKKTIGPNGIVITPNAEDDLEGIF